jgi:hypothetical protein
MLSDKYLWPVPELTLVHKAYKLASFQEPVTCDARKIMCVKMAIKFAF